MIVLDIIAFFLIILLFTRIADLKKANRSLDLRLKELEGEPAKKEIVQEQMVASTTTVAAPVKEEKRKPILAETIIKHRKKEAEAKLKSTPKPISVSKPPKEKSEFWIKLEKQFVENWTGILGSIIMVVGVGFLGIYAAVKLAAVYRFFMLVGFSAALFGGYFFLRKKETWIQFALWLRSSAAAIFLFACLGSGGIPGLQWIDDPMLALGLLLIGIVINLVLSWIGGHQGFASLHLLLSLVALTLAPQGQTTLIIAAVIALVGVVQTYRVKWDYHLLITISLFFGFHIFWFIEIENNPVPFLLNITGIVTVALVSLSAAFVHYRATYKSKIFDKLPFAVHLLNWFYFGLGLLMHSTGSQWKTIPLALGTVGAYFLARHAKKLEIRWLYFTDTLIALATGMFTVISLTAWGVDELTVMVLMFIESIVFLVLMAKEQEEKLYRLGTVLMNIIAIVAIGYSLVDLELGAVQVQVQNAFMMGGLLLAGVAFHIYTYQRSAGSFEMMDFIPKGSTNEILPRFSIIGILMGPVVISGYLQVRGLPWAIFILVAIVCAFLFLRQKYQSKAFLISTGFVVFVSHLLGWHQLFNLRDGGFFEILQYGIPFLLISGLALKWDYVKQFDQRIKWPAIYLMSIQLFLMAYYIFETISPLIFGVVMLLVAVIYFEVSTALSKKLGQKLKEAGEPDRYLAHLAYFAIAAFLVRHIYVHLQVEEFMGIFKLRLLIELFAIAVFVYMSLLKKPDDTYKSWRFLHPLLVELSLVFFAFTISLEVDAFWHPIIWIATGFGLLLIGSKSKEKFSRLSFYAVIFYWVAAFQVAFLTSSYVTPSTDWMDQAWLSGSISIVLLFAFLMVYYKYFDLKNVTFPQAFRFFEGASAAVEKSRNIFFLYPLIFCVAIFFFWSFDKSLLTLFWVAECLAVFIVSIVLKEQQFRYVALSGLVLCIIRLVFFDLSQSGTLTKALVFLGVGVIMLLMNSIYKKYKDRFLDE